MDRLEGGGAKKEEAGEEKRLEDALMIVDPLDRLWRADDHRWLCVRSP